MSAPDPDTVRSRVRRRLLDGSIAAYVGIVAVATLSPFRFALPEAVRARVHPPPRWSEENGMMFRGAGLFSFHETNPEIADHIGEAGSFYLYAEVRPAAASQQGPARIVSYGLSNIYQAFMLGQEGRDLVVRLADPSRDVRVFRGHEYTFDARLDRDRWTRVLVTVTNAAIVVHRDREPVGRYADPVFSPGRWIRSCRLVAGNEASLGREWRGDVRRLLIGTGEPPAWIREAAGIAAAELEIASGDTLRSPIVEIAVPNALPMGWSPGVAPEPGRLAMPWLLRPFSEPANRRWAQADWIRNFLLLLPLGVLLGLKAFPPLGLLGLLTATSLGIELTQLFLPDRYTQTTDLVLNVAGGLLGAILSRWALRLLAARRPDPVT